jgi:GNAT superfamily N-acetyltransferase
MADAMTVTIREGREADFPAVIGLLADFAAFVKMPDAVKLTASQMKKEKDFFNLFVAEEEGRIVGYALFFFAYYTFVGKSLYLEDLYVRPEFRRRKIGSLLLRKVAEFAVQNECKELRWQTRNWNDDAKAFYKKYGAKPSNEWVTFSFDEEGIRRFLESN